MDDANPRGRLAYERRAWDDAYDAFSQARAAGALEADDESLSSGNASNAGI